MLGREPVSSVVYRYPELAAAIRDIGDEVALDPTDAGYSTEAVSRRLDSLRKVGLGALRIPTELGGRGLGLRDFLDVIIAVASADSNIPHILVQHFFAVEVLLRDTTANRTALSWVAQGGLLGAAFQDPLTTQHPTVVRTHPDGGYVLDGRKVYTTGALYSDVLHVVAKNEAGQPVVAHVPADRDGVHIFDDWSGFGQVASASGSVEFTEVAVADEEISTLGRPQHVEVDIQQLVITATLAGIADAAARQASVLLRDRTQRRYPLGLGIPAPQDPLIQTTAGEFWAQATAARAVVLHVGQAIDEAEQRTRELDPTRDAELIDELFRDADIYQLQAQGFVAPLVVAQTAHVFDALGGSETSRQRGLDRHWRNARTLASHNPVVYKLRQVGDYLVNGTVPQQIGAPG
ncbi:MAG: hypothetical protein QM673_05520 [Gordonia sp. (in: high G+C Gram-positive bacteria)]